MVRGRRCLPRGWQGCVRTAALALVLALMTSSPTRGGKVTSAGLEVVVTTEKATYQVGEPITMTLRVSSRTGDEVRLHFSSAQRFDFAIRDARGRQVWRWSEEQIFAQVLETEALGPARPQITYRAQFRGDLAPGSYSVDATLVAKDRPLSATLVIQVQ